jgi:hypothetical protein
MSHKRSSNPAKRPPSMRDPATMTFAEYSEHLFSLGERARAVSAQRRRRFRHMCSEAGLEPMLLHNALVGASRGSPWDGVDYSKARRARIFQASIFDAEAIVSRYYTRTCRRVGQRIAA